MYPVDMRVALITNPRSGRNCGLSAAARAEAELRAADWDVQRLVTAGPGDAEALAREAAGRGFDAVVACGGDGTLSQVVTGLLDSGVPAGFIPAGTGNDFARTLGLSRDPAVAARQLLAGSPGGIDLLEVNGGALWSLNILGVGLDAAVAARINRRRRLTGGLLAYLTALAQEMWDYRPTQVRVAVDGEAWEGRALLVAVANATSYGAGMRIAPHADIADGLLDVVLVECMGRCAFAINFPRVFRGTHLTQPAVHVWRGREAVVETPEPSPVLVDGDIRGETPVTVRVSAGRVRFWLPGRPGDEARAPGTRADEA